MKDIVQVRKKAVELRRLGYSYSNIANSLKVSKSSVANWVRRLPLTENEKNVLQRAIKSNRERGRLKASISARARKVFKEKVAYENAEKEFVKFSKEPLFMLGLGLYWAHGLKQGGHFQFTNSHPEIINIILCWMKKYLNLPKETAKYRIFIDLSQKEEEALQFWARNIGVSLDFFQKTVFLRYRKDRKKGDYRGSLAIVVPKVEVIRKILAWQKLTMRYYK